MLGESAPQLAWQTGPLDLARLQEVGAEALLAVPVRAEGGDLALAADPSEAYGLDLAGLAARAEADGKAGSVTRAVLPPIAVEEPAWAALPARLLFAGTGDGGTTAWRRVGAALARASAKAEHLVVAGSPTGAALVALAEGLLLGSYRPPFSGSGKGPDDPVQRVTLVGTPAQESSEPDAEPDAGSQDADAALQRARIGAQATVVARTLAATPSNIKNPQWLAEQAQALADGVPGVRVQVRDEAWLAKHGMGGILAVGSASATPPRLVTLAYTPPGRSKDRPVVLVGKGITYDTGGISIKPREAMVPMKTDMSGAAVVLATVLAVARAQADVPVVAVLPLAENAVGAASYKPGDVLTMWDGTTVQVANTDAEGRLVLADAMAWARAEHDPAVLIDVATLTGAASLGLGKRHAALFSTDDDLSRALLQAGEVTGEPLWRMPLVQDYRHALDSDIADLCHINTNPHTHAGAITAALFLQHFAGEVPWAHLDIAGPGRAAKTQHEITEGPTGFTARALVHWLTS